MEVKEIMSLVLDVEVEVPISYPNRVLDIREFGTKV